MIFSRFTTSLTVTLVSLLFLGAFYQNARLAGIHLSEGRITQMLIASFVSILMLIWASQFAFPAKLSRKIERTFSWGSRRWFLTWTFVKLAFAVFTIVAPYQTLSQEHMAGLALLAVLFFMTFALPGLAYAKARAALSAEAKSKARSARWKEFGGFLMFAPVIPFIAGGSFGWILPTPDYARWVDANLIWLIPLIVVSYTAYSIHVLNDSSLLNIIAVAMIGLIFAAYASSAVRRGFPWIVNHLESTTTQVLFVTVTRIGSDSNYRACDHTVTVAWNDSQSRICDVPPEIWALLKPGSQLQLTGQMGQFGFRYEKIELADH